METDCVLCEVGTEFLYISYKLVRILSLDMKIDSFHCLLPQDHYIIWQVPVAALSRLVCLINVAHSTYNLHVPRSSGEKRQMIVVR
jgi:hypothetical protein